MGINGRTLLMSGLGICVLGLLFGMMTYSQLRDLPVHQTMRDVSELIWETCKTYLQTQGKFLLILEDLHRGDHRFLFRPVPALRRDEGHRDSAVQRAGNCRQLRRRLVRHPHQHDRQLPHGVRQPAGKPYPCYRFRCKPA